MTFSLNNYNEIIWRAACAKELIKLGDKIYELTKDERVRAETDKLRQYIADL